MYILSFIKKWFSKKEKPKETKPETSTQVVIFDMVSSEPFNSGDEIGEIDWFAETYFHVGIN